MRYVLGMSNTETRPITASEQSAPIDRAYLTPPRLPTIPNPEPLLVRLATWLSAEDEEQKRECSIKLRHVFGLSGARFVVDLFEGARTVASGVAMTEDSSLARALDQVEAGVE